MNFKDPIILSLCGLVGGIFVTVIILAIWKPDFVTIVDNDKQKHLSWPKLVSLSFVLGILTCIIIYLSMTKVKKTNIPKIKPIKVHDSY